MAAALMVIVFVGLASAVAQALVAQNPMYNADFFTYWAAGRLVLEGGDPYDSNQWLAVHQASGAIWVGDPRLRYPLPIAVLFAPLAIWPVPQAATIWLVISQCLLMCGVWLSADAMRWKRILLFMPFLILGGTFFRSTLVTLLNGQFSSALLFAIAASMWSWSRGRNFAAGMFIALLSLKPTVGAILLPFTAAWLLWRRDGSGLARISTMLAILWAIGAAVRADWVVAWLAVGTSKIAETLSVTYPPTVWGWASWLLGGSPTYPVVGTIIAAALVLAAWVFVARMPRARQWLGIIGVAMPVAVAVAPYLWNYDQVVLLVPIVAITCLLDRVGAPFVVTALFPSAMSMLTILVFFFAGLQGHDAWGWIVPLATALLFVPLAAVEIG